MILDKDCDENQIHGTLWNMFFHFFLDKKSLNRLREQCQKLVDLSISVESWEKGKYSNLLRFCSARTLTELHYQWCLYVKPDDGTQKSRLRTAFQTGMEAVMNKFANGYQVHTAARSAGPIWSSVIQAGAEHYRRYWKTGVTFDDAAQISAATFVNPTFAYDSSGGDFNVHYGTDPILAFHLGMAAKLLHSPKHDPSVSQLVRIAKEQFKEWCIAFRRRIKGGQANLIIRFWVGDALAFSKALRICADTNSTDTGVYSSAWEATPISLDGQDYSESAQNRAPLKFDIIDTSNLIDHLGLVNILVATVPLLQDDPVATLYTNSLLHLEKTFASRACTDIATLSLLLGVIPVSYLSGFATQTNIHDFFMSVDSASKPSQETVSWKKAPTDGMPGSLQIAPKPLGSMLFNIYLRMFKHESVSRLFDIKAVSSQDFIHYDRSSFVIFLALVKRRVQSEWTQVLDYMIPLIERDNTLVTGLNNVQDLYCQLHIHGVGTVNAMSIAKSGNHSSRVFDGWDSFIPPAVCIVLKVPRKCLKGIEGLAADYVGTPIFQCDIETLLHQNIFSAIQFFFGTTTPSASDPHCLVANEDTAGWHGNSPLIVSFYVPSWLLTVPTLRTNIALRIHPKSISSSMIYSVLGPLLHIFSADLLDKAHVQVVHRRPSNPQELDKLQGPGNIVGSIPNTQTKLVTILTEKDSVKVNGLTGRLNIDDLSLQATFRACPLADITVKQSSSFSMLVSIGQVHRGIISFPYPIDGSSPRTRIARKSSYIEVDVGLHKPDSHQDGLMVNPFPVVRRNSNLIPWNIHHVNLTKLPEVDITYPKCQWLAHHLSLTFCDMELSGGTLPVGQGELIQDIKRTIRDIFSVTGQTGNLHRVIIMRDPKGNGTPGEILMFLNCVRLDLPSHTIIADACAVPLALLSDPSPETVSRCLYTTKSGMTEIKMSPHEIQAWWRLLPILAERCRTWSHTTNCKFRSTDMLNYVPDPSISPLCECGRGKSLPPSFLTGEYKSLAPFATRIAFGPLFPVTYLESVAGALRKKLGAIMSESDALEVCDLCGEAGQPRLMKCSACGRAKYCSKECQKKDWKIHRIECKNPNGGSS